MTRVIHHRNIPHVDDPTSLVWIDRTTIWGNPFRIGPDGLRAEVIEKYRQHVLSSPKLMARLPELEGKMLVCHCKPAACHGDVLVQLLEEVPQR